MGPMPQAMGGFKPSSLFTTEQGVIYDLTNSATVFQERTGASATTPSGADGPIGTRKDLSPNNNYATPSSDAARALWRAAGYAEYDGIDDLDTATFTIAQPITRISCIRPISTNPSGERIYAGAGGNVSAFRAAPNISLFSGTVLTGPAFPADGTDFVLTERHSGATSRVAINNGAYVTGNAGTAGSTTFAIGSAAFFPNMRLYRVIEIARDLTDPEIALARTWCGAAAGLVL
jgi:hypothetical protein